MPFYRDPASILPEGMQRVLALMGMRDPRSAMPGPMMTIGPKAIPLDQPQKYIRHVLGETIGDMAEQSGNVVLPGPVARTVNAPYSPGRLATPGQAEAAAVRSWMDPRLAQNAREGFKIPVGDDAAAQEMSSAFEDRLVTWLANLFYGQK